MIVKSQSGNVANSINAQCYRGKDEVDWRIWCPERGSVILVNFKSDGMDSEIRGLHPAVVLSNNINNRYSGIINVAPLTSSKTKSNIPVHVKVGVENGLKTESIICLELTDNISKRRCLINGKFIIICKLNDQKMEEVDRKLKLQMGLI